MGAFDLTKETNEYCLNIARVLLLSFGWLRFNELFRKVNEMGAKMSKPTFSEHLNHLVEKGLVIRKVEGKQQVSYFFDWKRFTGNEEDVKELVKEEEPEEVVLAQKKRFNALPIDEQVKEILLSLFEKSIHELRLDFLIAIDPSRQFFHNLDKMTNRQSINPLWEALLENCTKDKDYANQVLEKIALSKDKLRKRPSETYEELKKATLIF
jgi:DNA-binding HxlR family transcriptional regulator